jgi:two-component system CheB/CheR fusion protein
MVRDEFMQNHEFHIVGIGASAGGLEALEQFFKNMPLESHLAFIVVQHLDPLRHSSMPEIMSRLTKMTVHVAEDGLQVEPGSVYLIPPNKNLGIRNGALYLEEQAEPRGLRLPVDFFLRSLAKESGPRAIAVILSGTGSDGTLGLKAIKSELGTVFAQEPSTAGYDGMPLNAINSGLVDFILSPQKMPAKIIEFARHAHLNGALNEAAEPDTRQSLQKLFDILLARTNHDFSGYKQSTILRRLQRRMSVKNIDNISQYTGYLKENEGEVKALLKDLLISVTSFFRDPEAFAALKERLSQTLKEKPSTDELRVWVAGSASGEEAYSLAMIILECLSQLDKRLRVQMYATDIDTFALNTSRNGIYPESISDEVSPERLKRFFIKRENSWQVNKNLREMVVFAPQDFIKDPPFSRMDLICCRNLMIYLESDIQKRLLPLLHYALKPGGLLLLGPSESLGEATDLFVPIDKKWRLFERREVVVAQERLRFPASFAPVLRSSDVYPCLTRRPGCRLSARSIFWTTTLPALRS